MDATAPGRVSEQHNRRAGATVTAVIAGNGLEETLPGSSAPGIEHRRGGLIHEEAVRCGQVGAQMPGDRLKMKAGPARPVAQGGLAEHDALQFGLRVKGQMVAELRDDDLGDQRLARQPTRHHVFGRMGPSPHFSPPDDRLWPSVQQNAGFCPGVLACPATQRAAAPIRASARVGHAEAMAILMGRIEIEPDRASLSLTFHEISDLEVHPASPCLTAD